MNGNCQTKKEILRFLFTSNEVILLLKFSLDGRIQIPRKTVFTGCFKSTKLKPTMML
jgi:hypothetical protein